MGLPVGSVPFGQLAACSPSAGRGRGPPRPESMPLTCDLSSRTCQWTAGEVEECLPSSSSSRESGEGARVTSGIWKYGATPTETEASPDDTYLRKGGTAGRGGGGQIVARPDGARVTQGGNHDNP